MANDAAKGHTITENDIKELHTVSDNTYSHHIVSKTTEQVVDDLKEAVSMGLIDKKLFDASMNKLIGTDTEKVSDEDSDDSEDKAEKPKTIKKQIAEKYKEKKKKVSKSFSRVKKDKAEPDKKVVVGTEKVVDKPAESTKKEEKIEIKKEEPLDDSSSGQMSQDDIDAMIKSKKKQKGSSVVATEKKSDDKPEESDDSVDDNAKVDVKDKNDDVENVNDGEGGSEEVKPTVVSGSPAGQQVKQAEPDDSKVLDENPFADTAELFDADAVMKDMEKLEDGGAGAGDAVKREQVSVSDSDSKAADKDDSGSEDKKEDNIENKPEDKAADKGDVKVGEKKEEDNKPAVFGKDKEDDKKESDDEDKELTPTEEDAEKRSRLSEEKDKLQEDVPTLTKLYEDGVISEKEYLKTKEHVEYQIRQLEKELSINFSRVKLDKVKEEVDALIMQKLDDVEFEHENEEMSKDIDTVKKLYADGIITKDELVEKIGTIKSRMNRLQTLVDKVNEVFDVYVKDYYAKRIKKEAEEKEKEINPEQDGGKDDSEKSSSEENQVETEDDKPKGFVGKITDKIKKMLGMKRKKSAEDYIKGSLKEDLLEFKSYEDKEFACINVVLYLKMQILQQFGEKRQQTYSEFIDFLEKSDKYPADLKKELIHFFEIFTEKQYIGDISPSDFDPLYNRVISFLNSLKITQKLEKELAVKEVSDEDKEK